MPPRSIALAVPHRTSGVTGARGNLTAQHRWVGSVSLDTRFEYDSAGQISKTVDPYGGETDYTYDDGSDTFLKQITLPSTGIARVIQFSVNSYTGLKDSQIDENGVSTSYSYDSMLRPTTVKKAQGTNAESWSTTSYPDPQTITVKSDKDAINDQALVATTVMDVYGRTLSKTSPDGSVISTNYDSRGRVYCQSDPHAYGSSYSSICNSYDAIDRVLSIQKTDNNTVTTTFFGNATTTVDEAGKKRKWFHDGLGRLTDVYEDPDGLNLHTHYSYDALNNLQQVDQYGTLSESDHQRIFNYDSLSRLVSSSNPESGPLSYSYVNPDQSFCSGDPNQPCSKTDAKGQVTVYVYDALNRMTQKSYNGQATAWNYYDGTFAPGVPGVALSGPNPNQIGRLSYSKSLTPTAAGMQDQYFGYDPVGRLKHWASAGPSEVGWAIHTFDAQYDLAGNTVSLTYPDGTAVTSAYDNLGRLQTVASGSTPIVTGATYYPDGTLNKMMYWNGTSEHQQANSRHQICMDQLTSGSSLTMTSAILWQQYYHRQRM